MHEGLVLLLPGLLLRIVQGGYLPGVDAGGALGAEKDAHSGEHQFQIRQHVHVVDVHQVKFQLLIGFGIVLAVDLGIAGQPGLDLQPQLEIRHSPVILLRDLRPLRSGADDAHIANQDVPELGQLIQPAFPDDPAHRRDPVVVIAGAQPGNAVLFRVHAHGPELDDLEKLAVLGQPDLLIEDRAAVIGLDGDGRDQKDRGQHDQPQGRAHRVEDPLQQPILRPQLLPPCHHDRAVKGLDMLRPLHDHIAHMGQEESPDVILFAILQDAVSAVGIDPRHKNGVIAPQLVPDLFKAAVKLDLLRDPVEPLQGLAPDRPEALPVFFAAVDQDRPSGRIQAEIDPVAVIGPCQIKQRIDGHQEQEQQRAIKVVPAQCHGNIHDAYGKQLGKKLRQRQGADPAVSEKIAVVGPVEQAQQQGEARRDQIIVSIAQILFLGELPIPKPQPNNIKQAACQKIMGGLEEIQFQLRFIIQLCPTHPLLLSFLILRSAFPVHAAELSRPLSGRSHIIE